MDLNKKHLAIIDSLLYGEVAEDRLSFDNELSIRTLNNYLNHIQTYFGTTIFVTKQHGFVGLFINNDISFFKTLDELRKEHLLLDDSQKERQMELLYLLLDTEINLIDDLAEQLYLSKSVIQNLLTALKMKASHYGIRISGKPNVGLSLNGSEYAIRKLLVDENAIPHADDRVIEQQLDELSSYELDEFSQARVRSALAVTYMRMQHHHYLSDSMDIDDQVFSSSVFRDLSVLKRWIEDHHPAADSEREMMLVAVQLLGRRASLIEEIVSSEDSRIIEEIISNTIRDIDYFYLIKLEESLFTHDIRLHIKHLINRLLFDIRVNNDGMSDIRSRSPFAYELSKVLADNIEKTTGLDVPITELGFLSLYFSVYLGEIERRIKEIHSVSLITNQGLSTIKLLKSHLIAIFGDSLQVNVYKPEENERFSDDELILSTIKMNKSFNKVIYIDDILDQNRLKFKIEQFLIYKEVGNHRFFNNSSMISLTNESDFIHVKGRYYYEVIKSLCQSIVDDYNADERFLDRIMQRERQRSTVNGNVGFPHAEHAGTDLIIKIAVLDEPLNDYPHVRIIFLLGIPEQNVNEAMLVKLYEEVLAITASNYILSKISPTMSYSKLAQLLNQEMRK